MSACAETLAERIARGIEQNSTEGGAIVPFPADTEFDDPFRMLEGNARYVLAGRTSEGFVRTPYVYRSAAGQPILAVLRLDHPTKDKCFLPMRCTRVVGCLGKAELKSLDPRRPLFNLDALTARAEAEALLVEGEKTCLAAQARFPDLVATTWPHGAKGFGPTDFDPLIGRDVVIWPDNDGSGVKAGRDIGQALLRLGARTVRLVAIPDNFPPKWDLADAKEISNE